MVIFFNSSYVPFFNFYLPADHKINLFLFLGSETHAKNSDCIAVEAKGLRNSPIREISKNFIVKTL